jgi:hypothetical protein
VLHSATSELFRCRYIGTNTPSADSKQNTEAADHMDEDEREEVRRWMAMHDLPFAHAIEIMLPSFKLRREK